MKIMLGLAALAALAILPGGASAQANRYAQPAPTGSYGRAPWAQPWQYDSGGGMDRRPELAPYQQGGGQQTGGPARNLIPQDGFSVFPK